MTTLRFLCERVAIVGELWQVRCPLLFLDESLHRQGA